MISEISASEVKMKVLVLRKQHPWDPVFVCIIINNNNYGSTCRVVLLKI